MRSDRALALVALTRGGTLRTRTGILLLSSHHFGLEPDLAARLQVAPVDFPSEYLKTLPPKARRAGLEMASILTCLNEIANASTMSRDCLLVYNFDLPLARLGSEARDRLWADLYNAFPYRRNALLIAMPETAAFLLPSGASRALWDDEGRMVPATDSEVKE